MRQPRLKAPDDWAHAYYHCVSRVVERRFALGEEEKQQFIHFMRLYEKFCQVRVISYCLMSNHFHLLVEVPAKPESLTNQNAATATAIPIARRDTARGREAGSGSGAGERTEMTCEPH